MLNAVNRPQDDEDKHGLRQAELNAGILCVSNALNNLTVSCCELRLMKLQYTPRG